MTGDRPPDLARQADRLAAEGRWRELHDLLVSVPGDPGSSNSALAYRLGEALYHLGRMEELAAYAAKLEAAMRRARDTGGVLRALNLAGIATFELGRMEEARGHFDTLMELAAAERDDDMLARATNNLGALANLQGRRAEALSLYRLAIPVYQRLGQVRGLAQTHQNLGMSYRDLARYEDAAAAYERAVELGRRFGYEPIVAMALTGRGEIAILRGDAELGARFAQRGLELARQLEDPITEGTALRIRAMARVRSRPPGVASALDDLARALELARETRNVLLEAESERDLGRVQLEQGLLLEAHRSLVSARAKLERLGAELEVRALTAEVEGVEACLS